MAEATARSWMWADGAAALLKARRLRDARFAIPLCVLLICGSFAAAAAIQMRQDRVHALGQAAAAQAGRSTGIALGIGRTFARYSRMALVFADSPQLFRSAELGRAEPAIRDIAIYDASGTLTAHLQAIAAAPALPRFADARWASSDSLAFRQQDRTLVVRFDPASLMVDDRQTIMPGGIRPEGAAAQVPGWPLWAVTRIDQGEVLRLWTGALPLYLFLILGPAAAAAWLAVLLVGVFERQAKAARALKALKSTRPVEARLMVRLANAERGAAEALRAKSEFIAHMSHELRTPLNAVIGFSEVIAEGYFGPVGHPKYAEYARDIRQAGENLHAKVGDILEFANIEAGRFPLKEEPVELAALTAACLDEHQGRAFSRRIDLAMGFAEPGLVRADPLALRRIVSNLVANALTYTAESGHVRADIRFEEGAGVLTLRDSGTGFSAAEAGRAGRPFERFDRGGTTGAGLGLAIAMELARRMGGAMRLAGGPGQGAAMEIRLPRL
jgi:signal transduction histidine kinase